MLAAGAGRRFGRPKALVEFDGARLVDRAIRLLRDGGCARIIVVTGAVRFTAAGADLVHNPRWETGMGSSLTTALHAVTESAAVVVPVDMPWLGPESVRRLRDSGARLATATYSGRPGHPVLLGAEHFPEIIATAVGDVGARPFLHANRALVQRIPCDDTGSPEDVDTPADLRLHPVDRMHRPG